MPSAKCDIQHIEEPRTYNIKNKHNLQKINPWDFGRLHGDQENKAMAFILG